jgi:hypothetical protein
VPLLCELPARADTDALAAAVRLFVARHAALRHRFTRDLNLEPVADRLDEIEFTVVERSSLNDVQAYVREQVDRPFDVLGWPLVRTGLIQSDRPLFHLAMDHLVSDGHSIVLAMREIEAIYAAITAGREVDLPPAENFLEHSALERRRFADGPGLDQAVAEVLGRLGGRPVEPPFPVDAAPWNPTAGRYVEYDLLDAEGTAALSHLCRDGKATLFMAVLAAFGIAARDVAGSAEAGILVSTHNREDPVESRGVGWYSNMLPLYFPTGDPARFGEAVRAVRNNLMALLPFHELPLCRLLDYMPGDDLVPTCFMSFVDSRSPVRQDPRRWRQIDLAPAFRMGYGIWAVHRESGLRAVIASPRPDGGEDELLAFERRMVDVLAEAIAR